MKRCSTLYVIKDCKLKQQGDTTTHLLKWKNHFTASNARENVDQQGLSFSAGGKTQVIETFWETEWQFLTNLVLPQHPAIMLLVIYPNKLKICVHRINCTRILATALFLTAKTWKQSRYPSVGKWISKLQYMHMMNITQ